MEEIVWCSPTKKSILAMVWKCGGGSTELGREIGSPLQIQTSFQGLGKDGVDGNGEKSLL
jgi:hypothetical protein